MMAFTLNPDLLTEVMPIIVTSMLGIFLVTGAIIGCVVFLNKFTI